MIAQICFIKRKQMENQLNFIDVEGLLFESNDHEVLLQGTIHEGFLKYQTEIIISQTQLNIVLNQLQKQNESIQIDQFICREEMYNNEVLYNAKFADHLDKCIDLSSLTSFERIKQIRA